MATGEYGSPTYFGAGKGVVARRTPARGPLS
jgi:hypothetical protein